MKPRGKKFLSYYRPYKGLLAADLACAFVVAAVTLTLPLGARYITKTVLDGSPADALTQIYFVGAAMVVLIAVHALCLLFVDYQGHTMGALMERDMRAELFDHYQTLSFGFFDEQKTGQLMNRLTNDTFWLGELYHHGPEDVVIASLKFFGTFVILLSINVPLTLIVFLFLPVMAGYAFFFNKRMNRALRTTKDRIGDINAQAEDTLSGMRVVQSFANERIESEKFAFENGRFLESRKQGYKSEAYLFSGLIAFTQLLTVAVVVLGGAGIVRGTLDLADLITYLLYVGLLVDPIRTALNFTVLYQEGITGFDRLQEMLELTPQIQNAPGATELSSARGEVAFSGVGFRYKEELEHVLKDLSLTIRAGEYVALVGPSGVGKTTLCSLIPRFYDVNDGAVLLDGHDVRNLSLHTLRSHIGVVQQDVYLFAGTVLDNIRYGRLGATPAEIIGAAKSANAHDFIMALPDGYDTDIGQRGVKLSGGQKQRLSIARVLLKNPPVIIFDEATSALDNESERAVQEALEALARKRTTIVIAHRLSTVRNADRIIVLTEEGVAEQGTHDALLAAGGAYAKLHAVQLRL